MEGGMNGDVGEVEDVDPDAHHKTYTGHSPFLKLHTTSHLIVRFWSTSSVYGLVVAMLAAIIASVGYECIHEYLRYLRHRALSRPTGSQCCGVQTVTCCEKIVQTILHLIRVFVGYFMMLCVMTMNIWLLIAITVGAAVGFGVGKPLVANAIEDSITSHGYKVTRASVSYRGKSFYQRSTSWRYQPVIKQQTGTRLFEEEMEFVPDKTNEAGRDKRKSSREVKSAGATGDTSKIVWIRRSFIELENNRSIEESLADNIKVQVPTDDQLDTTVTVRTNVSRSPRSPSRFASTSKVINKSFRSERNSMPRRSQTKMSSSSTLDDTDSSDRHGHSKSQSKSSSKLSRSTSASSSRYKPVSREILRQQSFASDKR